MTSNILFTGARSTCALELARHLTAAGHRVIATDTSSMHIARFSNAVEKFLVTPSPRFNTEGFIQTLLEIVEKEKIDLVIPIWEEVMYLSRFVERFPKTCKVFSSPFGVVHTLHHKWLFIKELQSFDIVAPKTVLLRSNEELQKLTFDHAYVLKACYSRGSRQILKVNAGGSPPEIKITSENPWIAQEFIHGKKFCSYSVCQQGKVLAHAAYPVTYTMDESSCLAFESIEHPKIFEWVKFYINTINFTGQAAFDFIETPEGKLYAIECNPRATHGVHLFKPEEGLAKAFLNQLEDPVFPAVGNTQQIVAGMIMYGWKDAVGQKIFRKYLKKFLTTKDVVYSSKDLKPFFCEPLVLASYVWKSKIQKLSIPVLYTHDLDWDEMKTPSVATTEVER